MLVLRLYVDNLDILPFYQLPQKVMPHVHALRVRVGNRVLWDMNGTLVILIYGNSRHPILRQHKTPNLPQKQNLLPHVRHSHIFRLSSRESHTLLRLGAPRNRPPCAHHYPPPTRSSCPYCAKHSRHLRTKSNQAPSTSPSENKSQKYSSSLHIPVYYAPLSSGSASAHCNTLLLPSLHSRYPAWSTRQSTKAHRSTLERKQNIRLVNIKIPKPPSCRNRNTVAPFHDILLS